MVLSSRMSTENMNSLRDFLSSSTLSMSENMASYSFLKIAGIVPRAEKTLLRLLALFIEFLPEFVPL